MSKSKITTLGMTKIGVQAEVKPNLIDPSLPIQEQVQAVLKTIFDPELPVDIYELGLIYKIDVSPENEVAIDMTLTSPACPVAGTLPGQVEAEVRKLNGVKSAKVKLVWEPPWTQDRMSEAARVELGLF